MPTPRPIFAGMERRSAPRYMGRFPRFIKSRCRKKRASSPKGAENRKNPLKNPQKSPKSLLRRNLMAIKKQAAARY